MLLFLEAMQRFAAACDRAGVEYFLGGSAANAFHGEPRLTNDLDFVVDATPAQVPKLADALGEDFELDVEALERAARLRSSWNIFYLPDFMKIGVFFKRAGAFDESEFGRRQKLQLAPEIPAVWVKSAEDSILRKLMWFRQGGGVSERQWRDVLLTIRASAEGLDWGYLEHWAERQRVVDELEEARGAADA